MTVEIQDFMDYLQEQVDTHAIYVWAAQGQFIADILPNLTSMESTSRVDEILTLISQDVKNYQPEGEFNLLTSRAFDCSGLGVYYFIKKNYMTSDTTADGLYALCTPIKSSALQPGDLVFREYTRDDGTKYKGHVGYYRGDGLVTEAKGRKWGVVTTKYDGGGWTHCGRPTWWDNGQVDCISRILKYIKGDMMRGDDVKLVQTRLTDLKYPCGAVDSVFGQKTEAAVKKFQTDNKAKVGDADGIVGQKTCEALGLTWAG